MFKLCPDSTDAFVPAFAVAFVITLSLSVHYPLALDQLPTLSGGVMMLMPLPLPLSLPLSLCVITLSLSVHNPPCQAGL